jgi:arginyl-tRNA synthetase
MTTLLQEVLEEILDDLLLHHLTDYMYRVTNRFSDFFRDCRVVGAPECASRLLLCDVARQVLRTCFSLLSIAPVERL